MIARALLAAALVAAAASCNWGAFDDLKREAWVGLAERVDTETGGDFGIEVLALPPDSGTMGIRFVISAGSPSGLALATFDNTGALADQIGFNAQSGGGGQLAPLRQDTTVHSMARFGAGDDFIAGGPAADLVVKYQAELANGEGVLVNGRDQSGRTVATGDLGFGSANPDVVTIGQLAVTIVKNGGMGQDTVITCAMKSPDLSSSPLVPSESLAVANVIPSTPHDEIIVGHKTLVGDNPRILVLDPQAIQNGQNCPETLAFEVDGAPPTSIQVAQLDGQGGLDLVTGTLGLTDGRIDVYLNPTFTAGANLTAMTIPSPDTEEPSNARGARVRIANISGGNEPEIIVGDPGATVNGGDQAGKVQIYRLGACSGGGEARGPACLIQTLFDPDTPERGRFGRALAVGEFLSSKGSKTILAVGAKDRLWVYFKVLAADPDPRD